jgi:hypothetical protein
VILTADLETVRRRLAELASSKSHRLVGWDSRWNLPSDWSPQTITSPENGMPFTQAGAWELIAELAQGGHPMREICLDRPPGDIAYEFLVDLAAATTTLYIKVQIKGGCIIGRSFHASVHRGLHGHSYRHQGGSDET